MATFSPEQLARALMMQDAAAQETPPREEPRYSYEDVQARRVPGMIAVDDQARLATMLRLGVITPEQYTKAVGLNAPPPGVNPDDWSWQLMPPSGMTGRENVPPQFWARGKDALAPQPDLEALLNRDQRRSERR